MTINFATVCTPGIIRNTLYIFLLKDCFALLILHMCQFSHLKNNYFSEKNDSFLSE